MSQHHSDGTENNIETHPVKLAIAIAVGAFALIVGIILLASYAVGGYSSGRDTKAFTPEETAKRIAPVAKLVVDAAQAPAAPAVATPAGKTAAVVVPVAIPAAAAAAKADGKTVYAAACVACHATGAADAPKLGDKAAWAPRIKTGIQALYASSLKGKGAMPPKGGSSAPDADIKAAVDYMVAQSK